jgi:hypothetical protein
MFDRILRRLVRFLRLEAAAYHEIAADPAANAEAALVAVAARSWRAWAPFPIRGVARPVHHPGSSGRGLQLAGVEPAGRRAG